MVHLLVGAFLTVASLSLLVTGQGPGSRLPEFAFIAFSVGYLLFGFIVRTTATCRFADGEIRYRNVMRSDSFLVSDIESIRLARRWWTRIPYLVMDSFDVSSPCAMVVLRSGQRRRVIATAPVKVNTVLHSEISQWCLARGLPPVAPDR